MKPAPKIRSAARPIRVAYLVEDGLDSHAWLDKIFASCFSRHGGRQSLVVPVEGGAIPGRYSDWIRVLDPDVVFLITYNNASYTKILNELLTDTLLIARNRDRTLPAEHPRVDLEEPGLTSLSWLPYLVKSSGILRARPEVILDSYPLWEDDGFITDNFGLLSSSLMGFPSHSEIADYVSPLVLTPPSAPPDRWRIKLKGHEEITDAYEILSRMQMNRGITTLGYLSNLLSQTHRVEHTWNHSFCIVVGDSFLDRVSCWNSALLYDDAQQQSYKTLRIPGSNSWDPENLRRISEFLRVSNWLSRNSHQPRVTVRSHSLNPSELLGFADQLRGTTSLFVEAEMIGSAEDCCPARVEDISRLLTEENHPSEIAIGDGSVFIPVPAPTHLKYSLDAHPVLSRGCWYVDLQIDRTNDNMRHENVRDAWVLPNKPQILLEFIHEPPARVMRSGWIGVKVNLSIKNLAIKQPEDRNIFRSILHSEVQYHPYDIRHSTSKSVVFKASGPSDKGRYLQGVLGLFGGLTSAEEVLGGHFWRAQFEKMAMPAKAQQQIVITHLKNRLTPETGVLEITDETGWQQLADRVVESSNWLKLPRIVTQHRALMDAWFEELKAAIKADPHIGAGPCDPFEGAADELNRSLESLCRKKVFYRGYEWICRHCSHKNWVSLEFLKNLVSCEVCQKDHQLPVDLKLSFRLNEFLATCLREHDTLTVIWALAELRGRARNSFVYSPQLAMYRDYPENQGGKPDCELDVLCLVDGLCAATITPVHR